MISLFQIIHHFDVVQVFFCEFKIVRKIQIIVFLGAKKYFAIACSDLRALIGCNLTTCCVFYCRPPSDWLWMDQSGRYWIKFPDRLLIG